MKFFSKQFLFMAILASSLQGQATTSPVSVQISCRPFEQAFISILKTSTETTALPASDVPQVQENRAAFLNACRHVMSSLLINQSALNILRSLPTDGNPLATLVNEPLGRRLILTDNLCQEIEPNGGLLVSLSKIIASNFDLQCLPESTTRDRSDRSERFDRRL